MLTSSLELHRIRTTHHKQRRIRTQPGKGAEITRLRGQGSPRSHGNPRGTAHAAPLFSYPLLCAMRK